MYRRIFYLNGLAIIGVVVSHAAGWLQTTLLIENWSARIQPYLPAGFIPDRSISYYYTIIIRQLTVFSIAAFLFASGFFIAYAVGRGTSLSWKTVWQRILNLLIPYLIWSVLIFGLDYLQSIRRTPLEYLHILLTKGADGPYYYVPLICYIYLLSPFLVWLAVRNGKLLVWLSAIVQIFTIVVRYLVVWKVQVPFLVPVDAFMPAWSPLRWLLFFSLGLVIGMHTQPVSAWLERNRWRLLAVCVAMIPIMVYEYDYIFRRTGIQWGTVPHTFPTLIYALGLILFLLTVDLAHLPVSNSLYQISVHTFGIYLLHMKLLEFISRFCYHFIPALLVQQWLLQPLMIVVGVGGPLLLMRLVAQSPLRTQYRLLFG